MYKRYLIDHTIRQSDSELPSSILETLAFLRRGANPLRYHTEDVLKPQSIGHHSFGVAWLCWLLSGGDPSRDLLLAAMAHDVAEHSLGDIPSPTKRLLGIKPQVDQLEAQHMRNHGIVMPNLSQEDDYTLRMADTLDGVLFCLRERELGNRTIVQVFVNFYNYAMELNPTGRALTILQYAKARWDSMGS